MNPIQMRQQRWQQLTDFNAEPTHVFLIALRDQFPDRPLPHPDQRKARIEWAWRKYQEQVERTAWLDDDAVPYLDVYTGTEIFAEAFGCAVHRPDDNMPFALPAVGSAAEAARLKVPDLDTPGLALLFEIADELRRRGGPAATMKMVDIQSPMDICALIWEKRDFYVALLETPEAVKELAEKVQALMTAFLDEWFRRYGLDFVAHYPDYYMPAGITLSEDEVGAVSRELFVNLFLPELAALSQRYGGIGMHCCAHARHQWRHFLEVPGLKVLNLVQPPPVLRDAYEFFAPHVVQMHSWCGDGDVLAWAQTLPTNSRVVIQAQAEDRAEAEKLAAALRGHLEGSHRP